MSKYRFDKQVPEPIRPELERHLLPLEWLIPDWCQMVYVIWGEDGHADGAVITSRTDYAYRRVVLTFYPAFLSQGESQHEQVIHDLLHAFAGVLVEYVEDTIKRLVPESEAPKFREHILQELSIRHESFVQDLAHCLAVKFAAEAPAAAGKRSKRAWK